VNSWEPVIGLEVHVHLKTRTKMFCRCATGFGDPENTRTCPVCLGHPGTLPVPNRRAVEWTLKLGLALGCEIAPRAVFHRKHYWYQDLPKGYQISQYDEPLCLSGSFIVPTGDGEREVGIVRAHLEEDAAKTVHVGGAGGRIVGAGRSLVDFNRGGTPLVEIVSQPDIRSAEQAKSFLELLRQTIVELGISDAEMEKGTLRCDANVSVRRIGETGLRTRAELKNMNSFRFVARGIDAEIKRQIGVWESGGEVVQETYDYDPGTDSLTLHRTKEEAEDYRYLPEPDLVPVEPERDLIERLRAELPELPSARIERHARVVGFEVAHGLVATERDRLYAGLVDEGVPPETAANFVMNIFAASGRDPNTVDTRELAKVVKASSSMTRSAVEAAAAASGEPGFSADSFIQDVSISDTSELEPVIERILAENEGQVSAYQSGKEGLLGFFVGQVMKETGGKANPKVVNDLLREKLKA
jgi:aspartyl-tRNA(Asn)/glutamyl-tRNA(Gln) amidotransferase subunit B